MSIQFVNSNYDDTTGVSVVIIQTERGKFKGYAYLNPADKDYASRYFGCDIAEMRAVLAYYKDKLKQARIEKQVLEKIVNKQVFPPKCYFYTKYNGLTGEIKHLRKEIKRLRRAIDATIDRRFKWVADKERE